MTMRQVHGLAICRYKSDLIGQIGRGPFDAIDCDKRMRGCFESRGGVCSLCTTRLPSVPVKSVTYVILKSEFADFPTNSI